MPIARRKRNPGSCQAGRKSQHLEVRWYGLVSCPIMEQLGSACSGLFKRQHRQESSETTLFASSSLLQGCKFCNLKKKLQILWVELGTICPFHTLLKQHSDGARCTRNTGMQQNALQS